MAVRILLIDTVYPEFVRWLYDQEPDLIERSHAAQLERALETCYHNVSVWADPLRLLGYEVHEVWANHAPLQYSWCREQGRLDLFPGSESTNLAAAFAAIQAEKRWYQEICAAQVRALRPDILWLSNLYSFDDRFLAEVEGHYRFAIGQNAAMPPQGPLSRFDLAVSASAANVAFFRERGLSAELLPHGFNPRILRHLPDAREAERRPLGFFGSFYEAHGQRREQMLTIAAQLPIEIWTDSRLPAEFAATGMVRHKALWGAEMYREVARTGVVLNSHLDGTGDWATNQRLYEVTGCGSVLLTDMKANLGDLFAIGSECVAYAGAEDCVEKARWLASHPAERAAIAEQGQRRTLTEHTVFHRGLRIQDILARHGFAA